MLEYLYLVFIGPIESLLLFVMEWGVALTGSYGLGIIIMSLVINILLIPAYHFAEKWQDAERSIQKRMADKLAKIKKAFSGKERYMATQTLYRQNGYHPIFALRASLGLLIQIPFFFAAYQLLSTYAPMQGASFAGIADLGKPDGLLSIGGLEINVLPILMTVISIASAWVYTYRLEKQNKIQLYVMAGIFLLLLYTAPAGMVFYWTCNNIFFLGKNALYEKLQVFGTDKINKKSIFTYLAERIKAFADKKHTLYLATIDWTTKNTLTWKTFVNPKSLVITLFAFTGRFFVFSSGKINKLVQPEVLRQLFILAITLLATMIFLSVPTTVYFSDPTVFSDSMTLIAARLTLFAFAFILLFSCLYLVFRGAMRTLFVLCIVYWAISAASYLFIFSVDYGVLDVTIFQFEDRIFKPYYILVDIVIALLLLIVFVVCIKKNRMSIIKFILSIFLIITVATSSLHFISSDTSHLEVTSEISNSDVNKLFGFSREGHNIVVIMLDMFTGDHLGHMLEEYPEWRTELGGFVWYPDTITESGGTIMTVPSIQGGPAATPYQINATASEMSLEAVVSKHTATLPALLAKYNFHSSIAGAYFLDENELLKYISKENLLLSPRLERHLGFKYAQNYDSYGHNEEIWASSFLTVLGGFQISPWSLRRYFYSNGGWKSSRLNSPNLSIKSYAVLDILPSISNVDSSTNTFKFITNDLTHYEWYIDGETLMPTDRDPYPETERQLIKVDGIIPEHYYAEVASISALLRWFQWMKDADVYDNTQIILVSDHGETDSVSLAKAFGSDISGHTPFGGTYPGRPHGLLLVKNANSRGPLQESSQLMASSDVMALIFEDIAPSLGLHDSDQWRRGWEQGSSRVRYHAFGPSNRYRHEENRFIIDKLYKITGTMFDKNNWEEVTLPWTPPDEVLLENGEASPKTS